MNFLGLVWIASYVGSFFSPQNFLKTSDYIAKVFAPKVLSTSGDTVASSSITTQVGVPSSTITAPTEVTSTASTLPIGWLSSRTHIPLIQSFLKPLPWLTSKESALLHPNATIQESPSISGPGFQVVLLIAAIPNQAQQTAPGATAPPFDNRLLKLAASLSRWSHQVGHYLKSVFPPVTVAQAPYPISNQLKNNDSGFGRGSKEQPCHPLHPSPHPMLYQVQVKGHVVAELPAKDRATAIAQHLEQVLHHPEFDPNSLHTAMVNHLPAGKAGEEVLFTVDNALARALKRTGDLIAIDWINNLRVALSVPALTLAEAQTQMYGLIQTGKTMEGIASWYGPYFHGRLTAAGETFNENELTAAHPSLPFDTYLKVTNLKTGNTIIVRVNDRGPYVGRRSLDLSRVAARCLGSEIAGVVPYEAVIMKLGAVAIAQTSPAAAPTPQSDARLAQQLQENPDF